MFNFVAALTGMRLSEINSLRKDNIKPTYIDLCDQYLRGELRPLKTKEARKIPICPELYTVLQQRINQSNDGYVFYLSDNGVWLTDFVPTKYISLLPG